MSNFMFGTNQLPVANWVETFTAWLTTNFSGLFNFFQSAGGSLMDGITNFLVWIPPFAFIAIVVIAAFVASKRKIGFTVFTLIGLLYIYNQGLWQPLMNTITLVIVSSLTAVILGIPLGILMAKSQIAKNIITPILDFMQTMPGFVYLIPAVAFFGIGVVSGVFASVIFALAPTVRFTNLAIRQVPKELVEASDSFGSTGWQKLIKVELPLARSTIMAGVNQTVMLSLSMVVIASMIGAPGLGRQVLSALQRAQVGNGFVAGLSLVILAIILDRFTQYLNIKSEKSQQSAQKVKVRRITTFVVGALALVGIVVGVYQSSFSSSSSSSAKGKSINIAYVEWDTEVASSNVIGQVLEDLGYKVSLTPLDNAVMWESLSKSQTDAMVSAWLPNTHASQYEKYKKDIENLGPNLKGVKVGLVVPAYMNVNSIADLKNEAGKTITGIEPGAGEMITTEKGLKIYNNLSDWKLSSSSTGAMAVELGQAYKNKKEIVVTGWAPHWMFTKYKLKFLEDPQNIYGSSESINTMVRKGLKKDAPEAYKVLDKFNWTEKDINEVMLEIHDGKDPKQAAKDWIAKNPDKVKEWTKGIN